MQHTHIIFFSQKVGITFNAHSCHLIFFSVTYYILRFVYIIVFVLIMSQSCYSLIIFCFAHTSISVPMKLSLFSKICYYEKYCCEHSWQSILEYIWSSLPLVYTGKQNFQVVGYVICQPSEIEPTYNPKSNISSSHITTLSSVIFFKYK